MLVAESKPAPAGPRFRIRTLAPPLATVAFAGNLGERTAVLPTGTPDI